jgi:outer membrane immunogenic protein
VLPTPPRSSATTAPASPQAGIEFGLVENLSGKIEYDFYGFGTKNYNFAFTPVSVRSNLHALIVGLNYRFNWSGGPKP